MNLPSKPEDLPGSCSAAFRASLPPDLAANPNVQRVLSNDLFALLNEGKADFNGEPRLIPPGQWAALTARILPDLDAINNPFHSRRHTDEVVECCRRLASSAKLDPAASQLLEIAALMHDYDHCGNRYRQLDPTAEHNDLSNEEIAALRADEFFGAHLDPRRRLELQGLILATSVGQLNPAVIPPVDGVTLLRPYTPSTTLEKILAFADIGRFILNTELHIDGSFALLLEVGSAPASFEDWLRDENRFLDFVAIRLSAIEADIRREDAATLRDALDILYQTLDPATISRDSDPFDLRGRYESFAKQLG